MLYRQVLMKRTTAIFFLLFAVSLICNAGDEIWRAKWISKSQSNSTTNSWLAFRKKVDIDETPEFLTAKIGADTKYWLWINGEMVVFEGGLKRGPARGDGYYDEVDIAPYLHKGENVIALLLWHFGKSGFSHQNSGTAAIIFEAVAPGIEIISDKSWEASVHYSYSTASCPPPNYRLPESNILYDARRFPYDWYKGSNPKFLGSAMEIGIVPGQPPFGKLVKRPIPLWKDYSLKEYEETRIEGNKVRCRLPYNCQFTPFIELVADEGKKISIYTDHNIVTKARCLSAEYITRKGRQEYESLGWLNGEEVVYVIPDGVEIKSVKYRETGYDTEFSGRFLCDDDFLNEYWNKSVRTLYVCMRDTYMDCPDRERAQWWGDVVNELTEAFYAFSPSANQLALKGIYELTAWQKPGGEFFSPVPSSNYSNELPMQMLASVGWYGFHNFYFYSGDSTFVPSVYEPVHRYLHEVWKLDDKGMPIYRTGEWDWPDAGEHIDKYALLPLWYYLALKGETVFAHMLGKWDDVSENELIMSRIAEEFDRIYWDGIGYRTPGHKDVYDDRVQALAVVSGIADAEKFPLVKKIFEEQYNATTYMQRYVLEALLVMNEPDMAVARMKKLYSTVMKPDCSTLYEHWNFEGSSNHAWTGGGIIALGQKIAGIEPLQPGFRTFRIAPQMGSLNYVSATVDSVNGKITVSCQKKGKYINMNFTVPNGTKAFVNISKNKQKTFSSGTYHIKCKI